ncbi:exostosin family protein [Fontisphaera persica]|uniref:exostosin domain-containing protein n=1 Tax=Fontisphaera persica TaxID=2974023 RepID=UPI0024BFDF68|nr:exostosin family protein [Fontisphaera persica]WCJ59685.1 exostosin family protein [Fontisphaera persica]
MFSFLGRNSHKTRKRIFELGRQWRNALILDTSEYNHFTDSKERKVEYQIKYWKASLESKYALCPRGAGTSSVRLFEMMEAGVAPVIISDDWIPCFGPKWEDFAIFVSENEIQSLPEILRKHENEYQKRGELARKAWEMHFSPEKYGRFLVDSILKIMREQKVSERYYRTIYPVLLASEVLRCFGIRMSIYAKILVKRMAGAI